MTCLPTSNPPPSLTIAGGWACETIELNASSLNAASVNESSQFSKSRQTLNLWHPADAEAVVEHQISNGNDADPFWCYLWPTARTLAQQVSTAPHPLPQQVLELGCGIGLVGLAALATGATVTFQDLRSLSVNLALHNAKVNGFGARAMGQVFDWRSPPKLTYDWILASDVLYHRASHEPLLALLEQAISQPTINQCPIYDGDRSNPLVKLDVCPLNGPIWIGDPGRREATEFIKLAEKRFIVQLFDANGTILTAPTQGTYQILVLHRRMDLP